MAALRKRGLDVADMSSCCFEYLFKGNHGWVQYC
jgi:hypothetical protein